jgi:N6-adenosine-specific RNA methylase IME4
MILRNGSMVAKETKRLAAALPDDLKKAAAAAIDKLAALKREVHGAPSFARLDEIASSAFAMQRRFSRVEEVAQAAEDVWVDAEIKLGEERDKLGRHEGGRPLKTLATMAKVFSKPPSARELGIAHKRLQRATKLFEIQPAKIKQFKGDIIASGKMVTPNAVLLAMRQELRRCKQKQVLDAAFSEEGPFDVVVIDPPRDMQKIDREVRTNQDAFDYPVMKVEEIEAWWEKNMAGKLKPDVHLFIWATSKWLRSAIDLAKAFGFRFVLPMVWFKNGGFQPVGLPQFNCEFVVYARLGAPQFVETKDFFCGFQAPRREHSRKPDAFYDTVRRVNAGSRVDVFARERRDGFAVYGNEVDRFAASA